MPQVPQMGGPGVFWRGADGKVYVKGSAGTHAAGAWDANTSKYWGDRMYQEIADPMQSTSSNTAPTGGGGGGGGGGSAAPKPDKSNDIALQMAGLGALDSQQTAGLGSIDVALSKLLGQYDTESTANEGVYRTNSDTNQNNKQRNTQTAFTNAAQGRRGLFGTLSSIGALSGDGITLANRAVQKGANDDLMGAADNYSNNQSALDSSIGTFRQEDKFRRENANTSAENARTNVKNDIAKNRMSFYSNLVNDYAAMDDAGNAKKYTDMAAALYPEMAKTSIPNANIAYSGAAFTAPSLSSYMAGADSTVVNATPTQPGQTIPGLVASPTKRKNQQLIPA